MAAGDIKWFAGALLELGKGTHNLSTAALKVMLTKATGAVPAISDSDPRYAAGGSVDFSAAANECTAGGNYAAGGVALSSITWTIVANVPTLRAADITITQHASNPTDARYAVIYNNTATNKNAVGFIDLGSTRNMTTGDLVLNFGGAGTDVLTLTQS